MTDTISYLNELSLTMSPAVVEELLTIYLDQLEETKAKYSIWMNHFDSEQIVLWSHTMKSSSKVVGVFELANLFSLLEKNPKLLSKESFNSMLQFIEESKKDFDQWRRLNRT